jgi:hypothetical protein
VREPATQHETELTYTAVLTPGDDGWVCAQIAEVPEAISQALTAQQLGELAFLLECAVRGRVTGRSLDSWLAQLAHRDDRRSAAEALRARLVEKVELGGGREAA